MMYFILGVIAIIAISYVFFMSKRNSLFKAMKLIIDGQKDSVVIKQNFETIKNIIIAHTTNVISTGNTIVFRSENLTYIVAPINKNEALLSLVPNNEEVKEYAEIEKEILSGNIPIETNTDIEKPTFEDVQDKKMIFYKDTPLHEIKALEWMSGAQNALVDGKKNTATELLMYAFLSLKVDGDTSLKEYIIGTIHSIENNNLYDAIDDIEYFIKEVSKSEGKDIQTFNELIFGNFKEQFHASKVIALKRNRDKINK